jgi:hypothetical protein
MGVVRGTAVRRPAPELAWTFSFLTALDGYELRSCTTAAGRPAEMMPWLPVVVVAVAQIAVRSIRVAGLIWHERVGAGLVIIPRHLATHQGGTGPWAAGSGEEAPQ